MKVFSKPIDVRPLGEKPHAVSIGHFTHLHIDKISKGSGALVGGTTQLASRVK